MKWWPTWADRKWDLGVWCECSCDYPGDALTYPTFKPLFVPFLVYSLAVFSAPWAGRAGPCLAQSRLVGDVWKGNLKRLQTNSVWRLRKNWLQMTKQNHSHDSGSSPKAFRSYRITESELEGTQKDQVQSLNEWPIQGSKPCMQKWFGYWATLLFHQVHLPSPTQ